MKKVLLSLILIAATYEDGRTQQIDSIYFHLYTDSLKKGTYNYINVDGKLTNGRWLPLGQGEVVLSSSAFRFSGNELIIPADCREEKVTVRAALRANPSMAVERTIWIKQVPDPELPVSDDRPGQKKSRPRRSGFVPGV